MAPTLYMVTPSPPVRSVRITAKALGLHLNEKIMDFMKGEHLSPEYLKINPQHTVPCLVEEDGFVVWDSHAINAYLVSKYAKNDSLYPRDLKKRAIVDQRLHFDSGVAFAEMAKIVCALLRQGKTSIDDNDKDNVNGVYKLLDTFLDGREWVAGDFKSIADYNLYATTTALNALVPLDHQEYGNVAAWLEKVDGLPEVEVSKKGLAMFEAMVASKLQ